MVYQRQARLDRVFAGLADPTRRAILQRLASGEKTISELAARFDMSLPAVSKHVRVLEKAGLARIRRDGRSRRTALVAAPLQEARDWIEHYRRFWEFQFDQLAAYLEQTDPQETDAWQKPSELRRTFAAAPERVFAAWTTPEDLKRWAGPGPMECPVTEVDLRVGGRFRIHMRDPQGKEYRVVGTYREVDPPRRLVYTWTWETDPTVTDSIVTVEFHGRAGKTEVVLRHEGLPDTEKRDRHEVGWTGCLEKLAAIV